MWLVLLVINSNINQLLSVEVIHSRLICLLHLERLNRAIIIVRDYWLEIVDSLTFEPCFTPPVEILLGSQDLILLFLLSVCFNEAAQEVC